MVTPGDADSALHGEVEEGVGGGGVHLVLDGGRVVELGYDSGLTVVAHVQLKVVDVIGMTPLIPQRTEHLLVESTHLYLQVYLIRREHIL